MGSRVLFALGNDQRDKMRHSIEGDCFLHFMVAANDLTLLLLAKDGGSRSAYRCRASGRFFFRFRGSFLLWRCSIILFPRRCP